MRRSTKQFDSYCTVVSRREALRLSALAIPCLALAACGRNATTESASPQGAIGELEGSPPLRKSPIDVPRFPCCADDIAPKQLAEAAHVLLPFRTFSPLPIVIVYHALRFWGPNAAFAELDYLGEALRGRWSKQMLAILTDDHAYQRFSKAKLAHLLVRSPYGIKVLCTLDSEFGRSMGSTHPGAYVQIMSEVGVSSTKPLKLGDGKVATLADVIRDDARRTHLKGETEWLVAGLCRYLSVPRWQNRFGEWISFDELAAGLCERPLGVGACFGSHVAYALAVLLGAHSQDSLLSARTADLVRGRLREFSRRLAAVQHTDGSWSPRWATSGGREARFTSGSGLVDTIWATGHHLEWLVYCDPELRPPPGVLRRAADYLLSTLRHLKPVIEDDWHMYLPLSHAGRALHLASGHQWPDAALACSV